MFVETIEHRVRLVPSRSFAALMTLYESNHVRLRQLLGDLRRLPRTLASCSASDLSLSVTVRDRSRYTTTLHMTYWFPDASGSVVADPDLTLRIYHDARLAEVLNGVEASRHAVLGGICRSGVHGLDARWRLNILLSKWMEYCLDRGHVFHPVTPPVAEH